MVAMHAEKVGTIFISGKSISTDLPIFSLNKSNLQPFHIPKRFHLVGIEKIIFAYSSSSITTFQNTVNVDLLGH